MNVTDPAVKGPLAAAKQHLSNGIARIEHADVSGLGSFTTASNFLDDAVSATGKDLAILFTRAQGQIELARALATTVGGSGDNFLDIANPSTVLTHANEALRLLQIVG